MKLEFTAGRRFQALRTLSAALNCAVVCAFFFLYRFLLRGMSLPVSDAALALIFAGIGALVVRLTLKAADRCAAGIYYRVGPEGLTAGRGARERFYSWERFTGASLQSRAFYGLGSVFPVAFRLGEESLELNQYVSDIYRLTYEILIRIEDRVSVPPELKKQAEAMRGTF